MTRKEAIDKLAELTEEIPHSDECLPLKAVLYGVLGAASAGDEYELLQYLAIWSEAQVKRLTEKSAHIQSAIDGVKLDFSAFE